MAATCSLQDEGASDTDLLTAARRGVSEQNWPQALDCLDRLDRLYPNNRDSAFQRARILAFQGKHKSALAIAKQWPTDDRESLTLRGDLSWYRGDFAKAEQWYRKATDKEAPAEAWENLLKAAKVRSSERYNRILKKAKKKFPEHKGIQALSPIEDLSESPPQVEEEQTHLQYRASLAATHIEETQNRSAEQWDVDGAIIGQDLSLALGASAVQRRYGSLHLTDYPLRSALSWNFGPISSDVTTETQLIIGGTPSAQFTPKSLVSIQQLFVYDQRWTLSVEVGAKWYPDVYAQTAQLGLRYDGDHWRFRSKGFQSRTSEYDFSALLGIGYCWTQICLDTQAIGGRDAASRPYLFVNDSAAFTALGLSLEYKFVDNWALRSNVEKRWEEGFQQTTIGLALLWRSR